MAVSRGRVSRWTLGEEETALECGEEGDGEVVRVGAVREVPGVVKTVQLVAEGG